MEILIIITILFYILSTVAYNPAAVAVTNQPTGNRCRTESKRRFWSASWFASDSVSKGLISIPSQSWWFWKDHR